MYWKGLQISASLLRNILFSSVRGSSFQSRMSRLTREGNTLIIGPPLGQQSASIILMHGLGDSGDGWLDAAQEISKALPYVKFILPTAPNIPVTLNGGARMNAWYDITGLTADRASEDCEGILDSVQSIKSILKSEIDSGVSPNRIVLAGFSQGGAMSLFCGLQLPLELKPAGLVIMSGYLPGKSKFTLTPGFEDIPIFHTHGTADLVVQHKWGEMTRDGLTSMGLRNYNFKSYPGMGHTITMPLLSEITAFLHTLLPARADLCVAPKDPSAMTVKELKAAIKDAGLAAQAQGLMEKQELVKLLASHYAETLQRQGRSS